MSVAPDIMKHPWCGDGDLNSKAFNSMCVNEESSIEWHNYNCQVLSDISRPVSMLIR